MGYSLLITGGTSLTEHAGRAQKRITPTTPTSPRSEGITVGGVWGGFYSVPVELNLHPGRELYTHTCA